VDTFKSMSVWKPRPKMSGQWVTVLAALSSPMLAPTISASFTRTLTVVTAPRGIASSPSACLPIPSWRGSDEMKWKRAATASRYRLAKMAMAEVLRTKTVSEPRGIMKVLVAKKSDDILGFTAFGFEASELMAAIQTAMLGHLPYTVLRDAILTHRTMSEGLNQLLTNVPTR